MKPDPKILAQKIGKILVSQGIANRLKWYMLEYWIQVELYLKGKALYGEAAWSEVPYFTKKHPNPKKIIESRNEAWGDKPAWRWKFADLLFLNEKQCLWMELKELGPYQDRWPDNMKKAVQDFIALQNMDLETTSYHFRSPFECHENKESKDQYEYRKAAVGYSKKKEQYREEYVELCENIKKTMPNDGPWPSAHIAQVTIVRTAKEEAKKFLEDAITKCKEKHPEWKNCEPALWTSLKEPIFTVVCTVGS